LNGSSARVLSSPARQLPGWILAAALICGSALAAGMLGG